MVRIGYSHIFGCLSQFVHKILAIKIYFGCEEFEKHKTNFIQYSKDKTLCSLERGHYYRIFIYIYDKSVVGNQKYLNETGFFA